MFISRHKVGLMKGMTRVLSKPVKSTDSSPMCSVCIANYNGEEYLGQCIGSVINQQDFPGSIEIIVHDDASTDSSVAFIQSQYPQVRLLPSADNVGFCVSNNRMVAEAKGTYVLLLNNDATLHHDALKTLYEGSREYGDGILGLPQYNADTGELIDLGSMFDPFLNPIPNIDKTVQEVGMIIGACLWLPRNLWKELGGFPEWFGSMAEDMYLCCLARLWKYPVRVLTDSGFDHWIGRSFGGGKVSRANKLSTSKKRRSLSERNKTFVMCICVPLPLLFLILPLHILLLTFEGILLSLIKQDISLWFDIYWKCLKEVIKYRKKLLPARKHVQSKREISGIAFGRYLFHFPRKFTMLLKYGMPTVK